MFLSQVQLILSFCMWVSLSNMSVSASIVLGCSASAQLLDENPPLWLSHPPLQQFLYQGGLETPDLAFFPKSIPPRIVVLF